MVSRRGWIIATREHHRVTSPTAEATRSERVQSEFESRVTYHTQRALSSEEERRSYKPKVGISSFPAPTSFRSSPRKRGPSSPRDVPSAFPAETHRGHERRDHSKRVFSSAAERPPDTREVAGSFPARRTILSCSSKAEHPADNRATTDRYRAGQPDIRTTSINGRARDS